MHGTAGHTGRAWNYTLKQLSREGLGISCGSGTAAACRPSQGNKWESYDITHHPSGCWWDSL
eukprot:1145281-Pelagomonas_calceolata.AAC.1